MNTRRTRSIARQTTELAFAVPQVVAHRVTRMALAGASPSKRDQQEFARMSAEKSTAFFESWNAMVLQTVKAQQSMALSLMGSLWVRGRAPSAAATAQHMQNATLAILSQGMAPVHRKAVANAKRLSRTPLR